MGVSGTTAYRWWRHYRASGTAGLSDRPLPAATAPRPGTASSSSASSLITDPSTATPPADLKTVGDLLTHGGQRLGASKPRRRFLRTLERRRRPLLARRRQPPARTP